MNKQLTFWSGISGVVFFVCSSILGGFQFSDYSHVSQFISEAYAIDTPYGTTLRFFGFLPSGILMAIFAFSAPKHFPKSTVTKIGFAGLGVFYGLATVIVSLFPCDKGCNKQLLDPSTSQLIHNLTGLLTYIFVPFCLLLIGLGLRKTQSGKSVSYLAIAAGLNCILFIGILISDPLTHYGGLYQRIIEGSVLFWIIACSIHLKNENIVKTSENAFLDSR